MCGITGILVSGEAEYLRGFIDEAIGSLQHRGPDSRGVFIEERSGLGLGHSRLAIQDLSAAGAQPMTSASGGFVLVLNGEIYNHLELRKQLEKSCAVSWKGHSDTETLLMALSVWGIEETLSKLVGMFAFALYDKEKSELTIARDRMGEKPLYYGLIGKDFVFGSELHILKSHPGWRGQISQKSLGQFLKFSYVPSPLSIYENVYKLPAGSYLTFRRGIGLPEPNRYWSVASIAIEGVANSKIQQTDTQDLDELESLLSQSIEGQLLSDVPLGVFLSGGIDSTAVAAVAQSVSNNPIKTFSVGFDEAGYDESIHAARISKHLHTDHHEMRVSSRDALAVIPNLSQLYTEPFADSSQIPTYLISRMAREKVIVALSGDGGDELFGGYNRYIGVQKYWPAISQSPKFVRNALQQLIGSIPNAGITNFASAVSRVLGPKFSYANPLEKLQKLQLVLGSDSIEQLYDLLVSQWPRPELLLRNGANDGYSTADTIIGESIDDVSKMMLMDQLSYLPDDILVKVDRASMGVGLETRSPFLDHRLVEFGWRLPLSKKIRNGQGKWLLRELVYKHVPKKLVDRPKMGFSIPLDSWLRGPLREWAESLLSEERLVDEGHFNPAPIRQAWAEHLSGKANRQHQLWNVLMFQSWLEGNKC